MFFGFWKHFILNDLSYTQHFATLASQLGYELLGSEIFCLLAKLWTLDCVHLHFQNFWMKNLRAGGLAKLSVLTQLTECGFVEDSILFGLFFFSAAFICPCVTRTTLWYGYSAVLWGHRIFCLLTPSFPSGRPLEGRTFLVCTFVAVLVLKHSHKSPVWLMCWLWFLFSVPNELTSVNSWTCGSIASPLAVLLWKMFHVRVPCTSHVNGLYPNC